MADNTILNVGSGGDSIRDVSKAGVKTPVCIIDVGGGGSEVLLAAGQAAMVASVPVVVASNQTTLPVAGSVASGSADSGNPVKTGGVYHAAPITLTDGQRGDLQLDASGYLSVHVAAGSAGNAAASATGAAVPAAADYHGVNVGGNLRGQTGVNPSGSVYAAQTDLASVGGASVALGAHASAASIPVVIASDQGAVPVAIAAGSNVIGGVTQSGSWTAVLTTGSATIGNVGTVASIVGALPTGTNTIGSVGLIPATAGGLSVGRVISAATTNATSVKASSGQLYGYVAVNTNTSSFRHLKIYDKASAPTVGTDTPLLTIPLPPGAGANLSFPNGIQLASGLALAITAGMADADTAAVGAAEVAVNVTYK